MKFLITILLLFVTTFTFSQNDLGTTTITDGFKIKKNGQKGTPFLFDKWHVGYGVLKNGKVTHSQPLNYDIYKNKITYKVIHNSLEQIMVLDDKELTGFVIKPNNKNEIDKIFSKISGKEFEKEKKEERYYEIVDPPSTKILIEYIKELDDPNASGWTSSTQNNKTAEYKLKTKIYVLNPAGKYEKIKPKNSNVLKLFYNKKNVLLKYINENNLDAKNINDLSLIVTYYYSL
ncbi:hypothetical protein ACG2LH_00660 [Zhouia sp. PK063]|uniref:hypothetical protein n=1 Tax=Zhouia sp. PK063 TaxID=3373602 RepID=UPI0037A74D08